MLRFSLYQQSLDEVDPDAIGLEEDSFERHLPWLVCRLVSPEDFKGFYVEDQGAGTCCPLMLLAMLLLQFRYQVSDKELVRRCRRDLGWRYAIGLHGDKKPPSVTSVRRFRGKLRELKGEDFIFASSLRLAVDEGLLEDVELQGVDSTNTDCRGAVVDTFNLVATGIGQVLRKVAGCLGERAELLAARWDLATYLRRSIKGGASIDWSDESARNALLTTEIRDADRLAELVPSLGVRFPSEVEASLELLRRVARQDVEELPDGTFRIARGTRAGRVISISDPEARHGRKSSSKVINGFKTHVTGTLESQFTTGIKVTDAATHDAQPTGDLIDQTEANKVKPAELVGDAAYGTGANRRACQAKGVELRTKLPTPSHKGAFTKRDFDIDIEARQVTCPAGVTTTHCTMVKDPAGSTTRVPLFRFANQDCGPCAMRAQCGKTVVRNGYRTIALSVYERELQQAQAFHATSRAADVLKSRSAIERLISHLVRLGMRHARFFGMHMVQFQAFMVGAVYNLQRLLTLKFCSRRVCRA